MLKDRTVARGAIHPLTIDSRVLAGNLLGDPTDRAVPVYVPAGHDGRGLPLLVDIVGFTGGGPAHTNWKNFGENVPERLDRLIGTGAMPPMGRWEDFLIDEMLPSVEGRFGCGGSGRRGLFGKSSGGYGAIVHALRRSDTWAAAACHSGDMGFELCYLGDLFETVRKLGKHDRSIETFMTQLEAAPKPADGDIHALMILAMAASYDPDPSQFLGIRLPIDLETGERIEDRWARWLAWDPVTLADEFGDNLRRLKALYIDCGSDDQYNLVFGARQLHRKLDRQRIPHRYEEFPDNHSSVDYRMDESLPFLARALTA